MRFAGLWVIATLAGFLLAFSFDLAFFDPAMRLTFRLSAQSQGELAVLNMAQTGVRWAQVLIAAALIASFQALLLQARLRLGVAWLAAAIGAAFVARLLVVATAHQFQPPGVNLVNALLINSLVPGVVAGLAAWLVLRRLRRAPLLLVAMPVAAVLMSLAEFEIARSLESTPLAENFALQSLASGLVAGTIQGFALAWILASREISAIPSPAAA